MSKFLSLAVSLLGAIFLVVYLLAPRPLAAPAPPVAPPPAPAPTPAPVASRIAPTVVEPVGEELAAAIDAFVGELKVDVEPGPQSVLEETLRAGKGPIDYKHALENSLRKREGAVLEAGRLLVDGLQGADETFLFQHSLALGQHPSAELSTVLLGGLDSSPAEVRPHLVFALRGSNEPRVVERFVSLYTGDEDPVVRAKAGFVLGERGPRLDPLIAERARQVARSDLQSSDPELVESAADVLGIPPQDPNDRLVLEQTLRNDPSETRRLAALRALALGGARVDELKGLLEEVARDPQAGPTLRDAAQRLLDTPR